MHWAVLIDRGDQRFFCIGPLGECTLGLYVAHLEKAFRPHRVGKRLGILMRILMCTQRNAFSGGGKTEEEQRANGANLSVDVAYQYLKLRASMGLSPTGATSRASKSAGFPVFAKMGGSTAIGAPGKLAFAVKSPAPRRTVPSTTALFGVSLTHWCHIKQMRT